MTALLDSWQRRCGTSAMLRFIGLDSSALTFGCEVVPLDAAASDPLDAAAFVQGTRPIAVLLFQSGRI